VSGEPKKIKEKPKSYLFSNTAGVKFDGSPFEKDLNLIKGSK